MCLKTFIHVFVNVTLTNLGVEGQGVPLEALFDGLGALLLVFQVVGTVVTVTVAAELTVRKTVTVPVMYSSIRNGSGDLMSIWSSHRN